MSESEKKDTEKVNNVGDLTENVKILIAKPNKEGNCADEQVEVSNGPAFKCLDDNFQLGYLTGTEVAQLKSRYMDLFDHLKRSRDSEFNLINLSKQFSAQIDAQETQLAQESDFPDNIVNEIGRQREQFLQAYNRLSETEERVEELRYFCETLRTEKKVLQKEFTAMTKTEVDALSDDVDIFKEMEKRLNELKYSNKELRVEIELQQRETKKLKEILKTEEEAYIEAKAMNEEAKKELDKIKSEISNVVTIPGQLSKETEKMRRKKMDLQKECNQKEEKVQELQKQIERFEKKKMAMEAETAELNKEVSKEQQNLYNAEKSYNNVIQKIEDCKRKELELKTEKATIDLTSRHISNKKKNLHDDLMRLQREKETLLKSHKKAELQLKISTENLQSAKQIFEKVKAAYEVYPKDDDFLIEKIKQLQIESHKVKNQIEDEIAITAADEQKIVYMQQNSERLFKDLIDLRHKVIQLTRVASQKSDQRERKAREFIRSRFKYQKTVDEVKSKSAQILEHKKKLQEVKSKLDDFAKLYDIVKTERNKAVNLLQTTTQKVAEMREKMRLQSNEADITRTLLQENEKMIQKERMKYADAVVQRDGRRYELCKKASIETEQKLKKDQLKLNIQRLNMMVNQREEDMVNLRKMAERTTAARNESAINLIEKNEELYILQEKTKVQDMMMKNGEMEAQAREEEINFLKRRLAEETRSLELLKKKLPYKAELMSKYKDLILETDQCSRQLEKLEQDAEDPSFPGRLRFLEGEDPTPMELQKKLESLEKRLAHKEEKMLEKDLIYEAVSRLVDQMQRRSLHGREDTLQLAKTVNGYKSELISLTKKMKTITAEMTIYMTQAKDLKTTVADRQNRLEEAIHKLQSGSPPTPQAEEQWKAIENSEKAKISKAIKEEKLKVPNFLKFESDPNEEISTNEKYRSTHKLNLTFLTDDSKN